MKYMQIYEKIAGFQDRWLERNSFLQELILVNNFMQPIFFPTIAAHYSENVMKYVNMQC
jgi:hypothetical protein